MKASGLILLSNQMALQRSMDVVANNVANASTTGFKRESVQFNTYLSKTPDNKALNFVVDRATYRDTTVGAIEKTGNPLDLAIQGKGYFQVQTPQGIRYTRGGAFQLDNQGQLVTQTGNAVLGDGGQAITVPDTATEVNISADGTVSAKIGNQPSLSQLGKIGVVNFSNEQAMQAEGAGLYSTTDAATPVTDNSVVQGSLEKSNVQSVTEMTNMIEVMRLYERTSNLIKQENARVSDALSRLSKTSL